MSALPSFRDLAAGFVRGSSGPAYLPDLTLWHAWHSARGTIPEHWQAGTLAGVCRRMGVPAWRPLRPWRQETPGIAVKTSETAEQKSVSWRAPSGTLQARWTLGPDGDWWQAEYPVKSRADLPAAAELVRARLYHLEPQRLEAERGAMGEARLLPLELPMRPYSDLLHNFLGWSEGFMLLFEAPEEIAGMIAELERKLQLLVRELARLPGLVVHSPDNLDGQFITPPAFTEHLLPSYRATIETLHAEGKLLSVHAGGMVRGLLPGLAAAGVDAIEGICGAPQSDASIAEARSLVGQRVTLWGGVAQDLLLAAVEEGEFQQAARRALAEVRQDPQAVLGVADKVPTAALPERLAALRRLAAEA
jgi:hypothetical protein